MQELMRALLATRRLRLVLRLEKRRRLRQCSSAPPAPAPQVAAIGCGGGDCMYSISKSNLLKEVYASRAEQCKANQQITRRQ